MKRALILGVLATALQIAPRRAHADADCMSRLTWIDARLGKAAHRARIWSWGWGVGLGVATAASLAAVPFVAPEDRIDLYVGAATSLIGVVPLLVMPLAVMGDARVLSAKIAAGSACTTLLPEAEAMLARDAASQAEGRAWWMHAANVAINGGAGLFLGLAYGHWTSGIVTAVAGTAIGAAMIFTQPVDSVEDLARYRRREWGVRVQPVLAPGRLGLAIAAAF